MAMAVPYVIKYVTGSMMSQEYSHQVSLARMPNWVAMYAMPPQSTQVVRRSAFLLSSSLTCTDKQTPRQRVGGYIGFMLSIDPIVGDLKKIYLNNHLIICIFRGN